MQNLFSRSEQTKKIKKMAGLAPSYWALQCPARLHGLHYQPLWKKEDWRGLEPSICGISGASLPNLRPSIRPLSALSRTNRGSLRQ